MTQIAQQRDRANNELAVQIATVKHLRSIIESKDAEIALLKAANESQKIPAAEPVSDENRKHIN
jgi:hypothetical protein